MSNYINKACFVWKTSTVGILLPGHSKVVLTFEKYIYKTTSDIKLEFIGAFFVISKLEIL